MVMHARRTQRMNDGYFEKHQTHPYQSTKYSQSKSYGSSGEKYERIHESPNGNYRSDSPESQSPRDRERSSSYQSKGSYLQKIREKERENRDYKISRDKYSDCARSPKDKRIRESEHRTNHDRSEDKAVLNQMKVSQSSRDRKLMHNNCIDKRDDRDRIMRVGDWSEHISSSGKKYYYNCKTEVSQWEKPREWIERERDRFRAARDRDRDVDRGYGTSSSSSSRSNLRHEKHSNSRNSGGSKDMQRDGGRHWCGNSRDDGDHGKESRSSTSSRRHADDNAQSTQDMDISPGDSTPTSEMNYNHSTTNSCGGAAINSNLDAPGPVLLATALPRLISHPLHLPSTPNSAQQESSPANGGNNGNSGGAPSMVPPPPPASSVTSNAPGPPQNAAHLSGTSPADNGMSLSRQTSRTDVLPLTVDTGSLGVAIEGPPTPTHSETPDCAKVAVPNENPQSGTNSSNLSTLQGVASSLQALRPQGPTITPSLANHVRDDLTNHIRGWPADILEKQAQKLSEEAHIMGSIQCAKVSAELKTARSLVRLTEIQATLQEQRILFLRQQIKMLEELKSQNSFMSDDS